MPKSVLVTILVILIFAVMIFLAAFYAVISRPNKNLKKTEVVIGNTAFQVEVASTTIERARGLSGRDALAEKEGLLFLFGDFGNYGFWMKDMKFPIDIVWIKNEKVIGFAENALPEPGISFWKLKIYYPPEPVDKVLEVSAGSVKRYGLKIGDQVLFKEG